MRLDNGIPLLVLLGMNAIHYTKQLLNQGFTVVVIICNLWTLIPTDYFVCHFDSIHLKNKSVSSLSIPILLDQ